MKRIETLQQTFAEVDPSPLDKWVDDFKRDQDPEAELRVYESMAEAYRSYCSGRRLPVGAKREVYQVVLLRSGASEAEVMPRLKLDELSLEDARTVSRLYKAPPKPIKVAPEPAGSAPEGG